MESIFIFFTTLPTKLKEDVEVDSYLLVFFVYPTLPYPTLSFFLEIDVVGIFISLHCNISFLFI